MIGVSSCGPCSIHVNHFSTLCVVMMDKQTVTTEKKVKTTCQDPEKHPHVLFSHFAKTFNFLLLVSSS